MYLREQSGREEVCGHRAGDSAGDSARDGDLRTAGASYSPISHSAPFTRFPLFSYCITCGRLEIGYQKSGYNSRTVEEVEEGKSKRVWSSYHFFLNKQKTWLSTSGHVKRDPREVT